MSLYRNVFIIIVFLSKLCIYSQNKTCDQWEKQSRGITDLNKGIELCNLYLKEVPEKCKIKIYIDKGNFYRGKLEIDSATYYIDKAIKLAKTIKEEEELVFGYTEKIPVLLAQNKLDGVQDLIKKSRTILENYPNSFAWVHYYDKKGYSSFYQSDYYKALAYMDSTVIAAKRSKYTQTLHQTYENKGVLYSNLGDYEKSIKNFIESIEYQEKNNNIQNIGITYRYLSNSFFELKQYNKAKEYILKAIEFGQKGNHDFILMTCYTKLASYNRHLNLNDEAEIAINKAMQLSLKTNIDKIISSTYLEKGRLYLYNHKKYDEAETFFIKSLESAKRAQLEGNVYDALVELIELNIIKKQPIALKNYLSLLTETLKNTQDPSKKAQLQKAYSKYNEMIGQSHKALKHYKTYHLLQDSILNIEVTSKVASLEKKYDTQKKELQIISLNKQKEQQKQITEKAKFKQNLFLLFAIFLLLLLGINYWTYKKLQRKQKELASTNQVKNHLFSIIAHDLRGLIIPFQRSGRILQHHIEKGNNEKTIEFSKTLEKNSETLSSTLDNLLYWSLEQMNGYRIDPEKINVAEELKEIVSSYLPQAKYKNTKIELKYKEDFQINFDKGAFHVIFRNLIGNALKYTKNGTVKIEFNNIGNAIRYSITDNGIGITKEQLKDIFTLKNNKQTVKGTHGEKGTGLGLNLIYKFVKANHGSIDVSSKEHVGTQFKLTFPKA